jgi:hypothetical protein
MSRVRRPPRLVRDPNARLTPPSELLLDDDVELTRRWFVEQQEFERLIEVLPEAREHRRRRAGRRRAGTLDRPSPPGIREIQPPPAPPDASPPWISTRAAARLLRVRNQTLYAAAPEAIAAGVARDTGAGDRRRHVRWRADQVLAWWSARG